ncbi:GNAT family N-acetyltransferase [Moritella sp. Urea-trap-13]|uniref:GNAT family N-acetyltransferase n=1 Tax=Moritella sp. Urea-trap-13 TaxID=2058327 RepID=UPI0018E2FAC3|nr:GNAT family N-acetyltransferase [Moritella sp. Urea-trap-13]
MVIRPVKVSDALVLSTLFCQLNDETPFLAMGEQNSAAELCEHLALFINSPAQVLYVIEAGEHKLLGFAIAITGYISGDSQRVSVVIGIEQASIGRGLGRQLLLHIDGWARLHQLPLLELTVMVNNENAIAFYENTGFKQQTVKPPGMIDDLADNELYMVKVV